MGIFPIIKNFFLITGFINAFNFFDWATDMQVNIAVG